MPPYLHAKALERTHNLHARPRRDPNPRRFKRVDSGVMPVILHIQTREKVREVYGSTLQQLRCHSSKHLPWGCAVGRRGRGGGGIEGGGAGAAGGQGGEGGGGVKSLR